MPVSLLNVRVLEEYLRMFDPTLQTRFETLVKVKMAERRKQFPLELAQINSGASASGRFHSSVRVLQIHQAHERELEVRAILAWESLVRVHRTFAQPISDTLRDDLKARIHKHIDLVMAELAPSLAEHVKRSGLNMSVSLVEAHSAVTAKHDIEVDLYVDSLSTRNEGGAMGANTQNYNFYGAVGSVQTGASATANVIQNLGADDRETLSSAIQQVREVLSSAPQVGEQQRTELLEIADECVSQMSSNAPNNTKLLTMFNVLGTAIQSISSAQPAYQALKVAVLPLGITLP